LHTKVCDDCRSDFFRKREDFNSGCAAAIDERECVARGDAGCATRVAFRKSSLFNQPCRGNFSLFRTSVIGWWRSASSCRDCFDSLDWYYGIFEEAAGAATVHIAFDEKHSFALTDAADCGGHFDERWRRIYRKEALQVGVFQRW
jgi:hypothetical protein